MTPKVRCRPQRSFIARTVPLANAVLANRSVMNGNEVFNRQMHVVEDGVECRPVGGGEIEEKTRWIPVWHVATSPTDRFAVVERPNSDSIAGAPDHAR